MLLALPLGSPLSVLVVFALGIAWWWGPVLFAVVIRLLYRDDIRWVRTHRRGARGEEAVGRILATLESRGFHSAHDLDTGRGSIDHIVVGPKGVFALETKAWRGRVYLGTGGRLMVSGSDRHKAVAQAIAEAKEVKRRLVDAGLSGYVPAAIILTATSLRKGPIKLGHVDVIDLSDVERFLTDRPERLDRDSVSRAVGAIYRNGGPITARNISFEDDSN